MAQGLNLRDAFGHDVQEHAARIQRVEQEPYFRGVKRAADEERLGGFLHFPVVRNHGGGRWAERVLVDLKALDLLNFQERVQQEHRCRVEVHETAREARGQRAASTIFSVLWVCLKLPGKREASAGSTVCTNLR